MGFIKLFYGVLFDDNGDEFGKKRFKRKEEYFTKNKKSYIIDVKNASYFKKEGFILDKKYFFYNKNNPSPLRLDKKCEPILNSDSFNSLLETKVIREMNKLDKGTFGDLFTFRNILIVLGVLGVIYYFSTGGTIT